MLKFIFALSLAVLSFSAKADDDLSTCNDKVVRAVSAVYEINAEGIQGSDPVVEIESHLKENDKISYVIDAVDQNDEGESWIAVYNVETVGDFMCTILSIKEIKIINTDGLGE